MARELDDRRAPLVSNSALIESRGVGSAAKAMTAPRPRQAIWTRG